MWSITTWPLTAPRHLDPVERKAPQESGPGRAAQTELAYSRSPWLWAPAQRLDRKGLAPVLVVFNAAMVACGICHQRVWGRGERQLAWRCAGHQTYSRYFRQSARGGIPALAVQRRDGCARYRPSARVGRSERLLAWAGAGRQAFSRKIRQSARVEFQQGQFNAAMVARDIGRQTYSLKFRQSARVEFQHLQFNAAMVARDFGHQRVRGR